MKLQSGEKIIKVYHHHPAFYFWRSAKVWGASMPFYFLAFIFSPLFPTPVALSVYAAITVLFVLVNLYDFVMYYLDTLVITTQRVVHLDWINPFRYTENQAMLNDIQNIESEENGFLSKFKWFDFGVFLLETASTRTVITFTEAPDPEGMKFFVTNLSRKHHSVSNKAEGSSIVSAGIEASSPASKVINSTKN